MAALDGAASEKGFPLRVGAPFVVFLFAVAGAAQIAGAGIANAVGLAFFMLGLSHGAGDENGGTFQPWGGVQIVAYLLVGLAITASVIAAPLAGLVVFFALSAWHFATADAGAGRLTRLAIAGTAIGGSALFQPADTAAVLSSLVASSVPGEVISILAACGAGGAVCTVLALTRGTSGRRSAAACLLAAAIFAPVLAVGFIFLAGHAWPIQRRQIRTYGIETALRAVRWPTIAALVGALALGAAVFAGWLAVPLAAALAIGMATPHMLVERVEA